MHYPKQAQPITMHLGLPERGRAIKGLVVCYVMWLGSIKGMGLKTCVGLVPFCGYRAKVPQHPIET